MLVALFSDVVASLGFSKDQGRRPVGTLVRLAGGNQVLASLVTKVVEGFGIGVDDWSGSVGTLVRFSRWSQELVPCVMLVVDGLGFREDQLSSPTSRSDHKLVEDNCGFRLVNLSSFIAWSASSLTSNK